MDRLKLLAFVLLLVACSMFFYQLGVSSGQRAATARPDLTDLQDREAQMEQMARDMLAQMQANPTDDSSPEACPPADSPNPPVYVGGPALAQIGQAAPACPVKP